MKMYRNVMDVNGDNKVVVTINQHENEEKSVVVEKNRVHHIQILDRSGSMYAHINTLVDNVIETLQYMNDEDIVTIIWFSSHNQYRTLLKGAKKNDPNIPSLLNTIRSTVNLTCFSSPVKEAGEIASELSALCDAVSITLFTDGEAVTPWSPQEEERKVIELVEGMKNKILAFNMVGYGYYYRQDFLRTLSAISEFGVFMHSTEISQYKDIFKSNYEVIKECKVQKVRISASKKDIIYLNRNFTSMKKHSIVLSRLNKEKNQFFIISDDDFEFEYNGENFNSKDINSSIPIETTLNFYYSLALNYYRSGQRKESLQVIVKNLRDKGLADSHLQAFTYDECKTHEELLENALYHPTERFKEGMIKSDNYLPDPNAFCVLDVLTRLIKSEAYYLPYSKFAPDYKRTSVKNKEEKSLFEADWENVAVPLYELVFNNSRLNCSIRMNIPGIVKINTKEAKEADIPPKFISHVYRNHTVILDGNLNIKTMVVALDQTDRDFFEKQKAFRFLEMRQINGRQFAVGLLNLKKFPIVNHGLIEKSSKIDSFFALHDQELMTMAINKVINYYIDKVYDASSVAKKEGESKKVGYSVAQIAVLEKYGINPKTFAYEGGEKKEEKTGDSYVIREIEFQMKGFSSLPKVEEALVKQKNGKHTPSSQLLYNAWEYVKEQVEQKKLSLDCTNVPLKNFLEILQKCNKLDLLEIRSQIAKCKMALYLSGDAIGAGQETDDKGSYMYTDKHTGKVLLVKHKRTMVEI